MTGPTRLDDDDDDLRLPGIEAAPIDDHSRAVMLCTFRLCDWQSPDVRTLSFDAQEQVIAAHLLDAHRRELDTLGRLARDAGLLL